MNTVRCYRLLIAGEVFNIVYYLSHFNRYLCQGTVFEKVRIEEVEGEPSSGYRLRGRGIWGSSGYGEGGFRPSFYFFII